MRPVVTLTPTRDLPAVAVYARSPAVRAGLRDLLESAGFEVTGQSGPGLALSDADVVVIDAPSGAETDTDGIVAAAESEGAAVVLLVDHVPARALGHGAPARGWLRREASDAELAAAVTAVGAGLSVVDPHLEARAAPEDDRVALTEREREVLALVAVGMTNRAIALRLGISEHTAKFHVGAVLSKEMGSRDGLPPFVVIPDRQVYRAHTTRSEHPFNPVMTDAAWMGGLRRVA